MRARSLLSFAAGSCTFVVRPATAFGIPEPSVTTDSIPASQCQRRRILLSSFGVSAASWAALAQPLWSPASAMDTAMDSPSDVQVPMKRYVDSAKPSLFMIDVPERFFAIRRSAKGDLPDAKTGQGRRGGTIFTAGDMSKAEVIAVERFPVRNVLEEQGYEASGDLTKFPSIGDSAAIATLLLRRREKDKPGTQNAAILDTDSVTLSPDGTTLSFSIKQQINVEKPELLMEEMGVSELYRTTVAKATLASKDGQLMAVFASALDQDFAGPDGVALKKSVQSFLVNDQSSD